MKKLSLFSLMLMAASMFLFLGGCRKDEKYSSKLDVFDIKMSKELKQFLDPLFFVNNSKYYNPFQKLNLDNRSNVDVSNIRSFFSSKDSLISEIVGQIGYPVWNNVIQLPDQCHTKMIPFAKLDEKRISGILFHNVDVNTGKDKFLFLKRSEISDLCKKINTPLDQNGYFMGLHKELAVTYTSYFEQQLFQEVDCDLIKATFDNIRENDRGSRGCFILITTITTYTDWYQVDRSGANTYLDTQTSTTVRYDLICTPDLPGHTVNPLGTGGVPSISSISGGAICPFGISGAGSPFNNPDKKPTVKDCRDADPTFAQFLADFAKNEEIFNPCNGQKVNIDLTSLEAALCATGKYNQTEFFNQINKSLEGVDHIIINHNLKTLCPLWDCLVNKLANGTLQTNFICQLNAQFDGSTGSNNGVGFHMHILPKDFSLDPNSNPNGLTITTISNGRPVIAINSSNCNQNSDLFDIFDTYQHEMIHANILQDLLNNGWSGTTTDFASAFHALVLQKYGPNAGKTEHELMLNIFVNDMVQSLIDANGGMGTFSDFEGLVLNGFGPDIFQYTNYTQIDINNKMAVYNNFVSNPANVSPNFVSCP